ncbi:MAG: Gfo/Idh/MocA family oxidoreductase, partial [Lachnospiraceae bacterium]|nr:Gfo/Idh/MocA family oxidoreductase [Lachnospiraceae bacterium]
MDKKIKVGVVGAGAISDIYIQNMIDRYDNLEVKSICSKNMSHAVEKAEKYGLKAYTYSEMLIDNEIDMIVNLTPLGVHYEIIKEALIAGKHVYTEKTITQE